MQVKRIFERIIERIYKKEAAVRLPLFDFRLPENLLPEEERPHKDIHAG